MATYRIVTPESEIDENYAAFEFMLGWFDNQGSWQQKLFTDWENAVDFDKEVFNNEDKSRVGSVKKTETNRVLLTVEDATINDLKVYLSIFRQEKVYRIYKDGTYDVLAPDSKSFSYKQMGIRYRITLEIVSTDEINLSVPA